MTAYLTISEISWGNKSHPVDTPSKTNAENYLQCFLTQAVCHNFFPADLIITSPMNTRRGGRTSQGTYTQNSALLTETNGPSTYTLTGIYAHTHCPTKEALLECDSEHSVFHRCNGPASAKCCLILRQNSLSIQIAAHNRGIYTPG